MLLLSQRLCFWWAARHLLVATREAVITAIWADIMAVVSAARTEAGIMRTQEREITTPITTRACSHLHTDHFDDLNHSRVARSRFRRHRSGGLPHPLRPGMGAVRSPGGVETPLSGMAPVKWRHPLRAVGQPGGRPQRQPGAPRPSQHTRPPRTLIALPTCCSTWSPRLACRWPCLDWTRARGGPCQGSARRPMIMAAQLSKPNRWHPRPEVRSGWTYS
jgi:hypothetical protein